MGLMEWFRNRLATIAADKEAADLPRFSAVIVGDEIRIQDPGGDSSYIHLNDLRKVLVNSNDTGPWGYDVWYVLEGSKGKIAFPLETDGSEEVLALLLTLPGFELRGMDSTDNAWFECWPCPSN